MSPDLQIVLLMLGLVVVVNLQYIVGTVEGAWVGVLVSFPLYCVVFYLAQQVV